MSTGRFNAARPKRAGEEFTRFHQPGDDGPSAAKKPRFDLRNPSALAPDALEEDATLDADVIGRGANTKRNAVNIDGYESDSDNEGFDARAETRGRGKGDANLFEQLQDYGPDGRSAKAAKPDADADDDMFGGDEYDADVPGGGAESKAPEDGERRKEVRFLQADEIQGQVESSKSGGHISADFALDPKGKLSTHAMDDQESSDDEDDAAMAVQEEGLDEEIGMGGLKKNAPKVDAFNMKTEQEEGRFDAEGNYIRKAGDPDAVHDSWLEGVSKRDMKRAAEAHEKREAERRQKRLDDDAMLTSDVLKTLILQLDKGESVLEALARLGKGQTKVKKIPKWKLKKQKPDAMDVDEKPVEDPEQVRIKESVDAITGAADQLLTRGQTDIYEQEREALIRQYQRETDEQWVEPRTARSESDASQPAKMWEFRWTDGRDGGAQQGPYDGPTMAAWQDAGYFGEGVEFRRVGEEGSWSRVVDFL